MNMTKEAKLRRVGGDHAKESMGDRKNGIPVAAHKIEVPPELEGVKRSEDVIKEIPIEKITTDPSQPRRLIDPEQLGELVRSIRLHGQLQAIEVYWDQPAKKYRIVFGERRYRACLAVGVKTIKAVIREKPAGLRVRQIVENLARADLNPMEEAKAFQTLMAEEGWTAARLSQEIGVSEGRISRSLALIKTATEVQLLVESGDLSPTAAYEIGKIESTTKQAEIAAEAAAGGWNRKEIIGVVRDHRPKVAPRKSVESLPPPATTRTSDRPESIQVHQYGNGVWKVGDEVNVYPVGRKSSPETVIQALIDALELAIKEVGKGHRFKAGTKVRFHQGRLKGLTGVVIERRVEPQINLQDTVVVDVEPHGGARVGQHIPCDPETMEVDR